MFDLDKMTLCLKMQIVNQVGKFLKFCKVLNWILSNLRKVIFCMHSYFSTSNYIKLWKSQQDQTGI